MYDNTEGNYNTAIGQSSLYNNETANNNTAVGYVSLNANTTGGSNTAVGKDSLKDNTTGASNVALGAGANENNTTGDENVSMGVSVMGLTTSGSCNTSIGSQAGYNVSSGDNNLLLGRNAGRSTSPFTVTTQDNRIVLGDNSITNFYSQVALTVTSDARDKMNFEPVPHGLDFVTKLEPYKFNFKKTREVEEPHGKARYGFKAQDILELEGDNNVIIDNEQPDHLKYKGEHLVPVLVNAIKELTKRLEELENK